MAFIFKNCKKFCCVIPTSYLDNTAKPLLEATATWAIRSSTDNRVPPATAARAIQLQPQQPEAEHTCIS
jgi:hypothetical protein